MTMVKVTFPLQQDADGYPPFAVEDVWASGTDVPSEFVVNNIPFFARQATVGDTVRVSASSGGLIFDGVVARSTNSLIRVILFDARLIGDVRAALEALGCSSEAFKGISILAVNCPSTTNLQTVQAYLKDLAARDVATYEEPILRQPE